MGFVIILDHNHPGMCFVYFAVQGRHFSLETKGHMCGTEEEKEKKQRKRVKENHIQRQVVHSGRQQESISRPEESSVRGRMCVKRVYDRCGRTGVRPVSFSEVEEGGREHFITRTNAVSVQSMTDSGRNHKLLQMIAY